VATDKEIVYCVEKGKVYHSRADCSYIEDSDTCTPYTIRAAKKSGRKKLCQRCKRKDNKSIDIVCNLAEANTLEKLTCYAKKVWGVKTVDLSGLDPLAVKETFIEMDRVFKEFRVLYGYISKIIVEDLRTEYLKANNLRSEDFMQCVPEDDMLSVVIKFDAYIYKDKDYVFTEYEVTKQKKHAPKGSNYAHVGAHDLGHAVEAVLTKLSQSKDYLLIKDWNESRVLMNILDVVFDGCVDRMSKLREISRDIEEGIGETIGEVFADYYANGISANKSSIDIMNEIKRRINMKESVMPKGKRMLPRFVIEGYAVYGDGKDTPFGIVDVKPNSPDWVIDDYKNWLENNEYRKRNSIK